MLGSLALQVDVQSTWRSVQAGKSNASMMTEELLMRSVGLQTLERQAIGVQTSADAGAQATPTKQEQAQLPNFVSRYSGMHPEI